MKGGSFEREREKSAREGATSPFHFHHFKKRTGASKGNSVSTNNAARAPCISHHHHHHHIETKRLMQRVVVPHTATSKDRPSTTLDNAGQADEDVDGNDDDVIALTFLVT